MKRHLSLGPKVLAVVLAFLFCFLLSVEARSEVEPQVSEVPIHVTDLVGNHAVGIWTVAAPHVVMCYGQFHELPKVTCLQLNGERAKLGMYVTNRVETTIVVPTDT